MGYSHNNTAVNHAEEVGIESDLVRIAVRAISLNSIVSAGNFFLFEECRFAIGHIEFVYRRRRDEGLIAIAKFGGVVLAIDVGIAIVGRLRKGDTLWLTAAEVRDAHLWQAILPLIQDVIVLEEVRVIEHDISALGNHFAPIRTPGIRYLSLNEAEVSTCVVDANVEEVSIMIGVVLNILLAGFHQLPIRHGIGSRNEASFAGSVARDEAC